MFCNTTAVSQWPAVLLVQSTGLAADLISLSWDKVQLCSAVIHRKFREIQRMYCEKGKIQKWMNETQTLSPDTYRLIDGTIYLLNIWVNICVTDIWDAIFEKKKKSPGDLFLDIRILKFFCFWQQKTCWLFFLGGCLQNRLVQIFLCPLYCWQQLKSATVWQ